jgi:5-methyltetrahydrofolate--homocysteine methyltransferase
MIVIGEQINATRKRIAEALHNRDAAVIRKAATRQAAAGANYLDINGGDPRAGREAENMAWLIEIAQACTDLPVAVDSANSDAARVGLSKARGKPILNSISLEADRLEPLSALAGEYDCLVVALLMGHDGPPRCLDDRLRNAEKLIARLLSVGRKIDEIIVDPCFFPISADAASGREVMQSISAIRQKWPGVHCGGGLSNISYGLPERRLVNLAALAVAIHHGMDAALVDPTQEGVMSTIYASEAVAGADEFCMNYVSAAREGKLLLPEKPQKKA